jgi:hypothetical protein
VGRQSLDDLRAGVRPGGPLSAGGRVEIVSSRRERPRALRSPAVRSRKVYLRARVLVLVSGERLSFWGMAFRSAPPVQFPV